MESKLSDGLAHSKKIREAIEAAEEDGFTVVLDVDAEDGDLDLRFGTAYVDTVVSLSTAW